MKTMNYLFFAIAIIFSNTLIAKTMPTEQQYICPMHPEVSSNEPDSCPKCGMDLELVAQLNYQCPMHPEVAGSKNDTCPKCGMDLEILTDKTPAHSHHSH